MRMYLISLAAGVFVGVIYGLLGIRSPAPPVASETTFPPEKATKSRTSASARPVETYTLFSGTVCSFA